MFQLIHIGILYAEIDRLIECRILALQFVN